jgi:hypothetical protein
LANQKKDRRRSRKRRGSQGSALGAGGQDTLQAPESAKRKADAKRAGMTQAQRRQAKRRGTQPRPVDSSGRPQAPWHPLPLSELLILVGMIGTVIGVRRLSSGVSPASDPALLAGFLAVSLGTIEFTLREHLGGYRSHTVMLSLLPVVALHSLVLLVTSVFVTPPRTLEIGMFVIDLILFGVLFRQMRGRFIESRRAAVFNRRR